ncbi:three-Cys-motif partner protein TcmP [Pseudoduganella umbonata]|uniref:23S rRNA (Adenine(2030)-N(6))-methyltransferase RlmJ n=1 Tax=Pseudoduganella umbonata TaxID=864828 RepID=A0A4P8HTH8_9BURK|nr:three-Cys-motif partner protein TcmP [Pseudoduganella umbonata]MBB3224475.1 three-Cys-motif partner protein [Pseudoduganella umbonata]QCP13249.1 23S rRNA (adenine(2030)-N(6))-methyltransferase RlmJ [Pseudoduganella umbonata]
MTKHAFGGPWTFVKLELLKRYLNFYTTALQRQPFKRVYIDAFAGTGECEIKLPDGSVSTIEGSAKIALEVTPAFDHVHLIDLKAKHAAALQVLANAEDAGRVTVHRQDANAALQSILSRTNWQSTRGVLFLDPYGMHVQWSTLESIARTKALDVWYLFPLSAVYRQAAKDMNKVDEAKAAALDSVLGTTQWREEFYADTKQESMLDDSGSRHKRTAGTADIASFVHARLGSIFKGWVSEPVLLPENGPPMFALFFAVANPSETAVNLSNKGAQYLFGMHKAKKIGRTAESAIGQDSLFG